MPGPPVLVWLRHDLRLRDNPALSAAAETGAPVVPVYVYDQPDGAFGAGVSCVRPLGAASRWWLHQSLRALEEDLRAAGLPLVLRRGPEVATLAALAGESGARAVFWNRPTAPDARARDPQVVKALAAAGVAASIHAENLLFPEGAIVTGSGAPYAVFTPFWRACLAAPPPPPPLPVPNRLTPPAAPPPSEPLEGWRLCPTAPDWAGGLRAAWRCGERAALDRLAAYIDEGLRGYAADRNRPEPTATSCLSPHLHFGEVSARQIWHLVDLAADADPALRPGAGAFLREIGWREFCASLALQYPRLATEPLQPRFARFPWRDDRYSLRAWQRGRTGYPMVDAGMRQLWQTGWMHNRVRMIAASFLVKHLLIRWQDGEAWFWDTLVDADLGNNAGGWQWVAGCGADAAPYFRIFNPTAQGERFDPDGAYVRRWLPALAKLESRWIHRPWQAPPLSLEAAGVRLGRDYPLPMVAHENARARALAALATIKAPN
jgi:deoxyribodipyrimidine photo-lyase